MIKLYCLIFILTSYLKVNAQIIKIPDVNFKGKLLEANDTLRIAYDSNGKPIKIDFNNDNNIEVSEALKVYKLVISNSEISSLVGIENFTNLTVLYCDRNQLENLNLNELSNLKTLDCGRNKLINLDVSENTALTVLVCHYNQLSTLDISKNTALTGLDCSDNKINTLETNKNVSLTRFWCDSNQLVSLDLSKNTNLKELRCYKNQLTKLDLSKNIFLTDLVCYANLLTDLDLSKNTDLMLFQCSSNKLKFLDISSSKKILTIPLSIILNGLYSPENNSDLVTLKINTAIQRFDEIKYVKKERPNVVISTYEVSSDGLSVKCINYNPITNTCKDY